MKRVWMFVLPLFLSGCFQASPGGLQGVWVQEDSYPQPTYTTTQTLEYVMNGDQITRTLTREIRAVGSNDRVTLTYADTGTFTVDTSFSAPRIDIAGIVQTEYPTDLSFAIAGAIIGQTGPRTELLFSESTALTFQPKGLYTRSGDTLAIKFGSDVDYPADLLPPFVYEVEKVFRLFAR